MTGMRTVANGMDNDEDEDGATDEAVKVVNLMIEREIQGTLNVDVNVYIPSRILIQQALPGRYSSCQMRRRKGFATSQQFQSCNV